MLNCRQFTELSSDYLDGQFHGWKAIEIKAHLLICRHCRRFKRHLDHSRLTGAAIAKRLWNRDDNAAQTILKRLQEEKKIDDS